MEIVYSDETIGGKTGTVYLEDNNNILKRGDVKRLLRVIRLLELKGIRLMTYTKDNKPTIVRH